MNRPIITTVTKQIEAGDLTVRADSDSEGDLVAAKVWITREGVATELALALSAEQIERIGEMVRLLRQDGNGSLSNAGLCVFHGYYAERKEHNYRCPKCEAPKLAAVEEETRA